MPGMFLGAFSIQDLSSTLSKPFLFSCANGFFPPGSHLNTLFRLTFSPSCLSLLSFSSSACFSHLSTRVHCPFSVEGVEFRAVLFSLCPHFTEIINFFVWVNHFENVKTRRGACRSSSKLMSVSVTHCLIPSAACCRGHV